MNTIRIRKSALLGSSALVVALMTSSGAWAQNCTQSNPLRGGFAELGGLASSTASSVAASIGNMQTAFLTQQGSAFVANPGGALPDTQGGGVWARGVGGEVDIKSTSTTFANQVPVLNAAIDSGTITCASKERETFAGVQVGADIARLNWNGWNINFGSTAGYLASRSTEQNGFVNRLRTDFEVPFIGTYVVATYGGFFADAMVRSEFYNMELQNPGFNFHNQDTHAHGVSVSASAGYQFQLQNSWFIEPSAGFIWSRTKVDPFNAVGLPVGVPAGAELSGTFAFRDIESRIGRATVRVGTSFNTGNVVLQPFVSASVFHEFADDIQSSFVTCAFCTFVPTGPFTAVPVTANFATATSRIGTYGQFSAGVAGQVLNTGWVGFVRGDYRTGDNIEGWTGNAGLRYNFLPEALPPVTKGIVKAPVAPVAAPVYWGGFYVGGYLAAELGTSRITFDDFTTNRPRIAGIAGGGQVGYNWQFGRIVAGIEGDIGATNVHGARTCGFKTGITNNDGFVNAFSPFFLNCENSMDWVATATGKLGWTWDRALVYVKGGVAFTEVDTTVSCIIGPNNGLPGNVRNCFNPANVLTNGFSASDDRFGGVVGFGSEFMLNSNWSAKTELNYMAFGKETVRADDGSFLRVNTSLTEVKVGVNYHFNPWLPR